MAHRSILSNFGHCERCVKDSELSLALEIRLGTLLLEIQAVYQSWESKYRSD